MARNIKSTIENNWEKILYSIQLDHGVSPMTLNTFIRPLKVQDVIDRTIFFLIDDSLGKRGIEFLKNKNYDFYIRTSIQSVLNEDFEITFITSPEEIQSVKESKDSNFTSSLDYHLDKSNLNPRYTFETFVVGENNRHAHAACVAVAEDPGGSLNPLFLYGGVGLGKTHLMQSVGHYILANHPDSRVLYVSSEEFTNELIEAIKKNKTEDFRAKYRNIDLLLLDDIQFIIGKEATQQEFFNTFNVLHEAGKQIVISSDKPPKEIENLEDRIKSRLEWGLPVDIQSPTFETRMAILRNKADQENFEIEDEVIQYIASKFTSNIRELEGALNKIQLYSKLDNKPITVSLAEEALRDMISQSTSKIITLSLITDTVSEHTGVPKDDILSTKRSAEIAQARQISMYLARMLTDKSYGAIGEFFHKDHSTVMHAIDKIKDAMNKDENLANTVDAIHKKLSPA